MLTAFNGDRAGRFDFTPNLPSASQVGWSSAASSPIDDIVAAMTIARGQSVNGITPSELQEYAVQLARQTTLSFGEAAAQIARVAASFAGTAAELKQQLRAMVVGFESIGEVIQRGREIQSSFWDEAPKRPIYRCQVVQIESQINGNFTVTGENLQEIKSITEAFNFSREVVNNERRYPSAGITERLFDSSGNIYDIQGTVYGEYNTAVEAESNTGTRVYLETPDGERKEITENVSNYRGSGLAKEEWYRYRKEDQNVIEGEIVGGAPSAPSINVVTAEDLPAGSFSADFRAGSVLSPPSQVSVISLNSVGSPNEDYEALQGLRDAEVTIEGYAKTNSEGITIVSGNIRATMITDGSVKETTYVLDKSPAYAVTNKGFEVFFWDWAFRYVKYIKLNLGNKDYVFKNADYEPDVVDSISGQKVKGVTPFRYEPTLEWKRVSTGTINRCVTLLVRVSIDDQTELDRNTLFALALGKYGLAQYERYDVDVNGEVKTVTMDGQQRAAYAGQAIYNQQGQFLGRLTGIVMVQLEKVLVDEPEKPVKKKRLVRGKVE